MPAIKIHCRPNILSFEVPEHHVAIVFRPIDGDDDHSAEIFIGCERYDYFKQGRISALIRGLVPKHRVLSPTDLQKIIAIANGQKYLPGRRLKDALTRALWPKFHQELLRHGLGL